MAKDFQLFLHTVDEYERFANHLPVKSTDSLTDGYSEADYIGIQTKLMISLTKRMIKKKMIQMMKSSGLKI